MCIANNYDYYYCYVPQRFCHWEDMVSNLLLLPQNLLQRRIEIPLLHMKATLRKIFKIILEYVVSSEREGFEPSTNGALGKHTI